MRRSSTSLDHICVTYILPLIPTLHKDPWPFLSMESRQPSPSLPSFLGHAYGVPANEPWYRDCGPGRITIHGLKKKGKNPRTFRNPKLQHYISAITNYISFTLPRYFLYKNWFGRWLIQILSFGCRICNLVTKISCHYHYCVCQNLKLLLSFTWYVNFSCNIIKPLFYAYKFKHKIPSQLDFNFL